LKARGLNWTLAKISNSRLNDVVLHLNKSDHNRLVTIHCLPRFYSKKLTGGYFSSAVNASYVHQISPILHANNHLTLLYNPMWSVQVDWHHIGCDTDLKLPTHAAVNYQIWQFLVTTLNQRLRSFPTESRAKTSPSSTPYK
jgi:hypothetical protein